MTKFRNIEQWVDRKRWSDKINDELKMYNDESLVNMKGFIYPDAAYIELLSSGKWHTVVSNDEKFHYDLRVVEEYLWESHSCQNQADGLDDLTEELRIYCNTHMLPHLSADELYLNLVGRAGDMSKIIDELRERMVWVANFIKRWEAAQ